MSGQLQLQAHVYGLRIITNETYSKNTDQMRKQFFFSFGTDQSQDKGQCVYRRRNDDEKTEEIKKLYFAKTKKLKLLRHKSRNHMVLLCLPHPKFKTVIVNYRTRKKSQNCA